MVAAGVPEAVLAALDRHQRSMMERTRESLCVALILNALSYFGQSKCRVTMRRLTDVGPILFIPCT
jgi:hypothetical protein